MKQKKLFALLLVAVMLVGLLCGCGTIYDGDGYERADADYYYEDPSYAVTEESAEMSFGTESEEAAAAQAETENLTEKIIYTANVCMQTREFDKTTASVEAKVSELGGFIESSNISGGMQYGYDGSPYVIERNAEYTLRIPSKEFDAFLTQVGTLGNVTSSSRNAENVTASYTDTELKLASLRTQEERLLDMLGKATDVETLVALEERLSEVRYEIEAAQSRLTNYDRQVMYSTVYLSLEEVATYTPTTPVTISFGQRLAEAFSTGLRSFADSLGEILLWFVEALPVLILLAAIVIVICVIISRKRKKAKAKKAAQAPKAES